MVGMVFWLVEHSETGYAGLESYCVDSGDNCHDFMAQNNHKGDWLLVWHSATPWPMVAICQYKASRTVTIWIPNTKNACSKPKGCVHPCRVWNPWSPQRQLPMCFHSGRDKNCCTGGFGEHIQLLVRPGSRPSQWRGLNKGKIWLFIMVHTLNGTKETDILDAK